METKFNSQICTSIEQSKALLALGLKKETADMTIHIKKDGGWYVTAEPFYEWEDDLNTLPCLEEPEKIIPAWSLHRLIEMLGCVFQTNGKYISLPDFGFHEGQSLYDNVINCIEWQIKEGYFNKEYLV